MIKKTVYKLIKCSLTNTLWCIGKKIFSIDLNSNKVTGSVLDDLKNPIQMLFDSNNGYTMVKNTTAEFAIYDKNFKLIWQVLCAKNSNTDYDFVYCEQSMICYGLTSSAGLKKLIVLDIKHMQMNTYILPESEDYFYSLIKIEKDSCYFIKSKCDITGKNRGAVYVKYEIIGGKLVEKDLLFKTEANLMLCQKLTEQYVYTHNIVYDLYNQKSYIFSALGLKDTVIYNVNLLNNKFFVITSKKIIVTDDLLQAKEVIEGNYLSSYYETNTHRYIGSWEHLKIESL